MEPQTAHTMKIVAAKQALKKYAPAAIAIGTIGLLAIGSDASAQSSAISSIAGNIAKPLCEVYKVLTSWLTVLLIVIAVAIGGLMKLFGSRNWSSMIIGALVAGAIVFLSGTIVKIVLQNGSVKCGTQGTVVTGKGETIDAKPGDF